MFSILKLLKRNRNFKYRSSSDLTSPPDTVLINNKLSVNIQHLNQLFNLTPDLIIRQIPMDQAGVTAALAYLNGMVDKKSINNNILSELIHKATDKQSGIIGTVSVGDFRIETDWNLVEQAILQGDSVLFIDGEPQVYIFDTKGWPQRAIEDSHVESSLRGAHQGFAETASQNIALIRRYIPNRELKIKEQIVGERGKTKVSILYLADIVNPEVLKELESRITRVDVDAILNTGELAEYIEDNPYTPFPQFILTERPDTAASHILQGRFAVVVDKSPSVLIAPAIFVAFFQSVDDYSSRWQIASFIRLLRFFALFIALFLPATYIALISFNYEVIPLQLILSIAETRTRVPFHPIMEAILMELTLEMMREAGIRLPAPIGQSIGIVGGIIIGQAAVQAGVVSNIMVIVVASTAIASFIIPNYDMGASIRLLRFPMMLLASMFGIVGIVCGAIALVGHFVSLESLGTPYSSPLAPWRFADMKDVFIRMPLWTMGNRPKGTKSAQSDKQAGHSPERADP
ncbi:spore germination protein [Paenibacillus sp. WQ 127069]|uniref:Spore germination protein n=1 Tax=Paenibacillus baimaensis TaxID=2982185 RepID=A0ABT2UNP0_9BACL|nr:spore germination protein [Paenibacillus sp. WQ 127069]MCU6796268.1 spore germination protein [Paenibacillus sp. WQ 127069]